jgi:hypothetical protein
MALSKTWLKTTLNWVGEGENALEDMLSQIQEEFDSHSEAWQEGDKGLELQDAMDTIEGALDSIREVTGWLDNKING